MVLESRNAVDNTYANKTSEIEWQSIWLMTSPKHRPTLGWQSSWEMPKLQLFGGQLNCGNFERERFPILPDNPPRFLWLGMPVELEDTSKIAREHGIRILKICFADKITDLWLSSVIFGIRHNSLSLQMKERPGNDEWRTFHWNGGNPHTIMPVNNHSAWIWND